MLGTIMVASVLLVIIPAHWELIRAKQEGRQPRLERGIEASGAPCTTRTWRCPWC